MAILDAQNLFSSAQAMPNGAAADSTNVIDLAIAGRGFDSTHPQFLLLLWSGTPVGTSLRIDLRSGATATDLTSSPTIHWSSGIVPQATYAAVGFASGSYQLIAMPNGGYMPGIQSTGGVYKRYLGLHFIAVGDASAGLLTAALVDAFDRRTYQASGFTPPTI